jgi:hypothetical protein
MMALSRSARLFNTPQRMRSRVVRPKKRSTMLSQEAEIGVTYRLTRGWAARHHLTRGRSRAACRAQGTTCSISAKNLSHRVCFFLPAYSAREKLPGRCIVVPRTGGL